MAGIYIHIPFCRKACTYCDFHFSTNLNSKDALLGAIHQEMTGRLTNAEMAPESIYIGGGTPSLLSGSEINRLLERFRISTDTEVTLEVNPDDVNEERISEWMASGISRLSVGVQTFEDDILKKLGRIHDSRMSRAALELINVAGFRSWTLDLMFALPGSDPDTLAADIDKALEYEPPHISAYCLTVEEGTALHHQVVKGRIEVPDEDRQAKAFDSMSRTLVARGYDHYEISNYAKPGHRAVHNSNYWSRQAYLGFGPSAHSFNGKERRWNVANNAQYIKLLNEGEIHWEMEVLDDEDVTNEQIMTGLRTSEGVKISVLLIQLNNMQKKVIQRYVDQGLLDQTSDHLRLTSEGRFFADRIASDLFLTT